jgi:hypothetical protein
MGGLQGGYHRHPKGVLREGAKNAKIFGKRARDQSGRLRAGASPAPTVMEGVDEGTSYLRSNILNPHTGDGI